MCCFGGNLLTLAPSFSSNLTTCLLPEGPKDELHVSATHGLGIRELQDKIEATVMRVTKQKLWKVIVPASSPALRCVN